jgi:hypothetical protein
LARVLDSIAPEAFVDGAIDCRKVGISYPYARIRDDTQTQSE